MLLLCTSCPIILQFPYDPFALDSFDLRAFQHQNYFQETITIINSATPYSMRLPSSTDFPLPSLKDVLHLPIQAGQDVAVVPPSRRMPGNLSTVQG